MFDLDYNGGDIKCPYCNKPFSVEWNTDYGDPQPGDHDTECLECKKPFSFSCHFQYNVLTDIKS